MTLTARQAFDFEPQNNPCAQCGKPIAKPIWSEPGDGCVAFVWACHACDYEFTSTAVFVHQREERPLAA